MIQDGSSRAKSACYVEDDLCSNPAVDQTIGDLISVRLSRRTAIRAATAAVATSWLGSCVYRFDMQGGCTPLGIRLEQPADLGLSLIHI